MHRSRSSPASARRPAEAKRDLAATIAEVRGRGRARAASRSCRPGSHPFSHPHEQHVSPDPRYAALIEEMQWTARRLQIFGIHYHVGVRSAEKSIVDRERAAVLPRAPARAVGVEPVLGGPRHRARVVPGRRCSRACRPPGLPPVIEDWADFEQFMHTLVAAEAIKTIREVWWDVRPHPNFGTVELRICDAMPTLREVAAVGALVQCLVHRIDTQIDAGEPVYIPREWTIRQNKWLAARYGLDAKLIVDDEGTPGRRPATSVADLIERARRRSPRSSAARDELADVAHDPRHRPELRAPARGRRSGGGSLARRRPQRWSTSSRPTSRGPDEPDGPRPDLDVALDAFLDGHLEELIAFRRELHAHPELSNEEHETTARVAERLRVAGLDAAGPPVGHRPHLRPARPQPRTRPVPRVALRADLDALAMDDETTVPYRSQVPGVAHACGHDVHTTVVLGAGLALDPAARARGRAAPGRSGCCSSRPRSPRRGGAHRRHRRGRARRRRLRSSGCTASPKLDAGQVGVRVGAITSAADLVDDHAARAGRAHRSAAAHRRPRRGRGPARRRAARRAAASSTRRSTSSSARCTRATRPT